MSTCFVIQPFDHAIYDKRYRDVFEPAIREAQLEPYRVDRDPSVSIPIDEIETGIRQAAVCFAEISTDNPNVWFELGFAIASGKEVIMVRSDDRDDRFPFDVQHRNILKYATESTSDFEAFGKQLATRLSAALKKREELSAVAKMSPVAETEGLSQHEVFGLVATAQGILSPEDTVSAYYIRKDMENGGFTKVAFVLAMAGLIRKGMLGTSKEYDPQSQENYDAYRILDKGFSWLDNNQDKLVLTVNNSEASSGQPTGETPPDDFREIDFSGDDIPF